MASNGPFGFLKPSVDAHVLGITSIGDMLSDFGIEVVYAPQEVCRACDRPEGDDQAAAIEAWIRSNRVAELGFSYRLSPADGVDLFARLVRQLERRTLFSDQGGPVRTVYFAGLPSACPLARERVPRLTAAFDGEETPSETLHKLGIRAPAVSRDADRAMAYDSDRMAFGEEVVRRGEYLAVPPPGRGGYPEFGTTEETLAMRIAGARQRRALPLYRAHMGQYLPDREAAVRLFLRRAQETAGRGHLDVLSIGSSQLSQERFGEDWDGLTNGGGVPLNSRQEFSETWRASRPMLVRSYAGTKNLAAMARMNDETIHNAWHALSIWWFCRTDNRGPYSLRENLDQMIAALRYIASAGKPFEPNVPHHFAFRGADEVTYVVSGYVAARAAKAAGIRHLVLQNMLNTPKYIWGAQDLARSRALLRLVRSLQDDRFSVTLQTRAGLDSLSATRFADPSVITESVQICRRALAEYRRAARRQGAVPSRAGHAGKASSEGEGIGIDEHSIVQTPEELALAVERVVGEFAQPAVAEEFLPGREFTVGVLDGTSPRPLPILEIVLGTGRIFSFEAKTGDAAHEICPAEIPMAETQHMGRLAVQAGRELGCRDYWRVDFRMDSAGKPCIIEVNTLPGLQPGYSDMTRMADPAGIGYDGLVKAIVKSARARS